VTTNGVACGTERTRGIVSPSGGFYRDWPPRVGASLPLSPGTRPVTAELAWRIRWTL
jgi:hypothetical protein